MLLIYKSKDTLCICFVNIFVISDFFMLAFSYVPACKSRFLFYVTAGPVVQPGPRRGRGGGHRGRGRYPVRRDGTMKFDKDFDFESANAQFNKEEIDKEFQSKLKLKGKVRAKDQMIILLTSPVYMVWYFF